MTKATLEISTDDFLRVIERGDLNGCNVVHTVGTVTTEGILEGIMMSDCGITFAFSITHICKHEYRAGTAFVIQPRTRRHKLHISVWAKTRNMMTGENAEDSIASYIVRGNRIGTLKLTPRS